MFDIINTRQGKSPADEQSLIIGICKHYYLLKDESVRYQKSDLTKTRSKKKLLVKFLLFDVYSSCVYGEFHSAGTKEDLLGFLARAWSPKARHPMHGIPRRLNVAGTTWANEKFAFDLELIRQGSDIAFGAMPSGFPAGAHTMKTFEDTLAGMTVGCASRGIECDLKIIQACSGLLSMQASIQSALFYDEAWSSIPDPSSRFYDSVNRVYQQPWSWRSGNFDMVFNEKSPGR